MSPIHLEAFYLNDYKGNTNVASGTAKQKEWVEMSTVRDVQSGSGQM